MRRGTPSGGAHQAWGRRVRLGAALLALAALAAASLEHALHEHPHRQGQELTCAVCTTPLGQAAAAPDLAPPEARPVAPPQVTPPLPPAPRAPLSFSPKQSPPSA